MTSNIAYPNPLKSNGFILEGNERRLGRLTPSNPHTPIAQLREQFHAQGYLWLKGILDRQGVFAFRKRFFAAFAETGLLKPGTDPGEGIYSGGGEDHKQIAKLYHEIVRWCAYEAFCLQQPIWEFYEQLFDGAPYLHKRKIIRHTKPFESAATGAHYDLTYLRAGTDQVATSWIPIGDVPVEMGGLVYLEGSHTWGVRMEEEFRGQNHTMSREEQINAYNKNMSSTGWLTKDLPHLADRLDTRWLIADYEAGDMVVHSAYMIHAATINESHEGRLRLSTDIRFQRVRDEIDVRWNNHWSMDDML
ncbi:MAG: phytanoyl-CoA dioxygenase family protein [Roseiflexaceae bacterium]|jgi:ectoine hydroxylase-related dioxygenase (phytanoyl-CoA dioxygenase family)|nr:phytanoyl-CoA dioxygenase family protein [Chloroflexaceae bacterium]